ncbi:hypothetical protein B0H13DRAFT_1856431 [Mycena leptocephala]|nr:hypothetical protein B0H13DRAFT_1856431 [Mycena leptocephala]
MQNLPRKYSSVLLSFSSGALALSLANAAKERLATEAEGGAIPTEVSRAIHVPPYKPAAILGDSGLAGLQADMIAMRDMLVVSQTAATVFLLACHDRTVTLLMAITNVDTVSAEFKFKLSSIVKPLLAGSQFPATMYDVYIAAVAAALKDELCTVKLDVLAKAMRQKKEQTEKLAAVATANADAEMANGAKTVGELVSEQVKVELQKYHGMPLPSIPPSSSVLMSSSRSSKTPRSRRRRCRVIVEYPGQGQKPAPREEEFHEHPPAECSTFGQQTSGWWRKRKWKARDEPAEAGSGPRMKIQCPNPASSARENSNAVLTITNRAFHNMTNVNLSFDQVQILAFNSKGPIGPGETKWKGRYQFKIFDAFRI